MIKLHEIAKVNSKQIDKNFTYKDIGYIDIASVTKGNIDNIQNLETTDAPSRAKRLVKKNDILYSTVRPNLEHYVFIKDEVSPNTVASTGFAVITPDEKIIDPYYLYCLITQPRYTQYLSQVAEQAVSTYPTVSPKIIEDLEFNLPPLSEQKRISSILSSFDNKIEQLKKENNILEDIAQNIFKEWFIKYNFPNKDGKPYKDNKGKMIDSELGLIPEGWKAGKLGDLVEIKNGFAFKSEDYRDSGYSIIRTMNFEDTGYINNQSLVYISEQKAEGYKNFNLSEFDLCVVMVGASLGKTALVTQINIPALQNQNMWSFKPREEINRLYNNLLLEDLVKQNSKSASGSAREFFRKDYFYNVPVVIPSGTTIANFDNKIRPIFNSLSNNLYLINILSSTKISLLSKLIK